jgi:hypothetical protein
VQLVLDGVTIVLGLVVAPVVLVLVSLAGPQS